MGDTGGLDAAIGSLFTVGLHLQQALPLTSGVAEHHLRDAIDELDRLLRAVRDAVFAADRPHSSEGRDAAWFSGAPSRPPVIPHNAPPDLRQRLETVQLLQERMHRLAVALTLSQEDAAEMLDRLADTDGRCGSGLRAHAQHARAAAGVCREFAISIDELTAAANLTPALDDVARTREGLRVQSPRGLWWVDDHR